MWSMRIAWLIKSTTDTHSDYVILTAFLLQQWLSKRDIMLRLCTHACLVPQDFIANIIFDEGHNQ
jgi:hypothetical protein